ncbi:globin family protein [Ramlibacter sp.]|jgi:hemoglobin-like flavoprotein|uniref:globin family protein n=1 Tax=Ramlibacter sp. TaxID=1917967 RepID=UPI00260A0CE6|nr:globin family protein [Ramlibacter sp.]MDB5955027.1 putative hemoprotein [Ramlibacter sp.]
MTPEQIALVQASFEKVKPVAPQAAEIFYARLFELAPQVRGLFRGDMAEQGRKLMAMLAGVVGGLSRLDVLVPTAQQLARRHVAYGALPEHYPVVGQALLETLAKGLGEEFTPQVRQAWETAYGTLSQVMIAAQQEQPPLAMSARV